jgi:hypothetical protein
MIYVVLVEEDGKTFVSHGIDSDTLESVVLPQEPFESFRSNCKITPEGWVLN